MLICKCGADIPQARIEFLESYGKPKPYTCVKCSTVKRVAGYNLRSHKATGELVVTSQAEADLYYKSAARTNGIVAAGVRFRKKN